MSDDGSKTIGDIVSSLYQELISICEQRGISIGMDIPHLSLRITEKNLDKVYRFFESQIQRCLQSCGDGDHIIIAESMTASEIVLTIKNSGKTLLSSEKEALKKAGYEAKARYGYDTCVSLRLAY